MILRTTRRTNTWFLLMVNYISDISHNASRNFLYAFSLVTPPPVKVIMRDNPVKVIMHDNL